MAGHAGFRLGHLFTLWSPEPQYLHRPLLSRSSAISRRRRISAGVPATATVKVDEVGGVGEKVDEGVDEIGGAGGRVDGSMEK